VIVSDQERMMLFEMRHLERLAEIKHSGQMPQQAFAQKRPAEASEDEPPKLQSVHALAKVKLDVLLRKNKRATIEEVWTELQAVTGLRLDGDRRVFVELALLEAQEEQLPPPALARKLVAALLNASTNV